MSLWPCSSSPTEARWSHNSGNNFLLHMVRTPSALSRLSEANRNSLLLCLGASDGGVGGWEWIQCCLRGKSSHLFSDLSVSTWLLLTLCRVKTMIYLWRLLPLIHLTVVRICWWLSGELKSHYSQVFSSSATLQNISHVCSHYISQSLAAHMHMQRERRERVMMVRDVVWLSKKPSAELFVGLVSITILVWYFTSQFYNAKIAHNLSKFIKKTWLSITNINAFINNESIMGHRCISIWHNKTTILVLIVGLNEEKWPFYTMQVYTKNKMEGKLWSKG